MIKKSVDVSLTGDDSRPIAMAVQLASQFKSNIEFHRENMTVNAKSIMGMMTLGLVQGQNLQICVDGEDEEKAMEEMKRFLTGK